MEVLLIGNGAIAGEVMKRLAAPKEAKEGARISAVLVRPNRVKDAAAKLGPSIQVVDSLDKLDHMPDLAAECAGHKAVAEWGEAVLVRGIDLIVISIGALSDGVLYGRLKAAAQAGGAKLLLQAGAVAGADALAAAKVGGLARVRYISRKPPLAWKGTPAEGLIDLENLAEETVFFEGRADEAARQYPQNANVAATIALAGAGFEATEVALIADPEAAGNIHQIEASGPFGEFSIEVRGKPLPDNPKTSTLAAHSVVHAIRIRAGAVEI